MFDCPVVRSELVHALDGNFYGITESCGAPNNNMVFRLDNPDPCDATLAVGYTPGALKVTLTIRTPVPELAGVWLFTSTGVTTLWIDLVSVTDPARSGTTVIPLAANLGRIGVASFLQDLPLPPVCFDWRAVYTGR